MRMNSLLDCSESRGASLSRIAHRGVCLSARCALQNSVAASGCIGFWNMRSAALQTAAGAVWVGWVAAAGLTGDVHSLPAWFLLLAVGALPPLVLLLQWKVPLEHGDT